MSDDDICAEHSFEVAAAPASLWADLERLRAEHIDLSTESDLWWLPGFESRATEVRCAPGSELVARKAEQPCEGTTIAITFEHTPTGCTIRIVQSGFDPGFVRFAGEHFWRHAGQIFADAELFFRHGLVAGRAWRPGVATGLEVDEQPFGLTVRGVEPGTWAERVGLAPGDVLLSVSDAPVFDERDLLTLVRVARPGRELASSWVRGRDRMRGSATA